LNQSIFKLIRRDQYVYHSLTTDSRSTITINAPECHNKCNCTCKSFVKDAVCLHLVSVSLLFNLNLFKGDYVNDPEKFVQKTKKGNKRTKYGHALDKEIIIEHVELVKAPPEKPVHTKKGRGRPPKNPIAAKVVVEDTLEAEAEATTTIEAEAEVKIASQVVRRSKRINKMWTSLKN